jgi:hypothetical protein
MNWLKPMRNRSRFSKQSRLCQILALGFILSEWGLTPLPAGASAFIFQFGDVFYGTPAASPTRPWVDALFEDVSPGVVRLTVSNLRLTASENLAELYLNLNPNLNPTNLVFKELPSTGAFDWPAIKAGVDALRGGCECRYDIAFYFNEVGGDDARFTGGESLVAQITGPPNLQAYDFAYLSTLAWGAGPFYAAAKVERIGPTSATGWIDPIGNAVSPVPEPAPLLVISCGLGLLFLRAWRQKA